MSGGDDRPGIGDNGGPPIDDEPPVLPSGAKCRLCRHWMAPPEADERAYDFFRLGLSRRRVKRPAGSCDRVILSWGKRPSFSAPAGESVCWNYEEKPPAPRAKGGGFVTIYRNGRVAWQGREEDAPPEQTELDL